MNIRLAREIQPDSIVDGKGIRTVIWTQGCSHNCKGCHNPDTHDFNGGFLKDIDVLKEEIRSLEMQDGITLSGGDPFFQIDAIYEIAKFCNEINLNVWCYTGFTFEELLKMSNKNPKIISLLSKIDVLVDGKFVEAKKSYDCKFRGSTNQRLIDVSKSLKKGEIVLYEDENTIDFEISYRPISLEMPCRKLYI